MMYAKLIFKNAKRSVKDYLIYIVTMIVCILTLACILGFRHHLPIWRKCF